MDPIIRSDPAANTTLQFNLRRAAIHLSAAQDQAEFFPSIYSERTWGLLTDALSILSSLEDAVTHEENTHPAER